MSRRITTERARQKVREALKLAAGDPQTEAQIRETVDELLGFRLDLQQFQEAMEHNHTSRYIRSEFVKEADVTAWFITKEGLAKENLI